MRIHWLIEKAIPPLLTVTRSLVQVLKSQEDEPVDLESLASLLYGIYGEEVIEKVEQVLEKKPVEKAWRSEDHPRGKDGRFIPKGSAEARATASDEVAKAIAGDRSSSPQRLMSHLSLLTVKQIRELARKHGKKVPSAIKSNLMESLRALVGDYNGSQSGSGSHKKNQKWQQSYDDEGKIMNKRHLEKMEKVFLKDIGDPQYVYRVQPRGSSLHKKQSEASDGSTVQGVFVFPSLDELAAIDWVNENNVELVKIKIDPDRDLFETYDQEGKGLKSGRGVIVASIPFGSTNSIKAWAMDRQRNGWKINKLMESVASYSRHSSEKQHAKVDADADGHGDILARENREMTQRILAKFRGDFGELSDEEMDQMVSLIKIKSDGNVDLSSLAEAQKKAARMVVKKAYPILDLPAINASSDKQKQFAEDVRRRQIGIVMGKVSDLHLDAVTFRNLKDGQRMAERVGREISHLLKRIDDVIKDDSAKFWLDTEHVSFASVSDDIWHNFVLKKRKNDR